MLVDLRTDAISRPTEEMIDAMTTAARSIPGFGLKHDPTVSRLEEMAAAKLGKESALFCPTCTLCNQIAVHIFCSPGESFVAEELSHLIVAEAGAVASLSGVMPVPVKGSRGTPDVQNLQNAVRKGDELRPRTALIVLENTHVYSGGAVVPVSVMEELSNFSQKVAIPIHLDGSRLFNAASFLGVSADEIAGHCDSVSISLNKGLAAPLGAILAGERDFVREAVRVRQMFGGGWRPANILAAAGIVALETMTERIGEDHIQAKRLAEGLKNFNGLDVDPAMVDTNIVLARVDPLKISMDHLISRLEKAEILVIELSAGAQNTIRMVTHHEITPEHVDHALDVISQVIDLETANQDQINA